MHWLGDSLMVGVYPIAGAVKNAIDDDPDTTILGGFGKGLKSANPFGEDYKEGETTWSDVIGEAGWNPTSMPGKIAKGALGLVGDIFLDPITYLTFGTSALLKGTGEAGVKASHALASSKILEKYGVDISSGLTEEVAKKIITKHSLKEGVILNTDELLESAKEFTSNYNKLVGANRKATDITFSLKNAPFGDKIFGKSK